MNRRTIIRPVRKLANARIQIGSAIAETDIDPKIASSVVAKCHQLHERCSVANSRLEISKRRSSDFSCSRLAGRLDSMVANAEGLLGTTKCVLFRHRHEDNGAGRNQRLDLVLGIFP